jgi:hypothetical protein
MTDWIEHDGGPQPVADDVWVELQGIHDPDPLWHAEALQWERGQFLYRILNQHLIDAARLEGIRLGLEAAAEEANKWQMQIRPCERFVDDAIRALDPETIAREAVLDKLASEAQEQGMGYKPNVHYGVKVVRPPSAPLIAKEADQ